MVFNITAIYINKLMLKSDRVYCRNKYPRYYSSKSRSSSSLSKPSRSSSRKRFSLMGTAAAAPSTSVVDESTAPALGTSLNLSSVATVPVPSTCR